jgi:hypothetical protein
VPEAMDDAELLRLLDDDYADAQHYTDEVIGPERAKALDYYLRRPMGDERPGRSKVISPEVYKVVEGISTAIADIYVSTDKAIEFTPKKRESIEQAKQQNTLVNYVFYVQNGGFLNLVEAIKDGVWLKAGFLTWRWEKTRRMTQERYQRMSPEGLYILAMDMPEAQIVSQTQNEDGTLDITLNIIKEKGQAVVESVPPEEIMVCGRARSQDIQKAPVVIWRCDKTKDELIKCGYDAEIVEGLQFFRTFSDNQVQRRSDDAMSDIMGTVELRTHWREMDFDGDGIVELRRIVRAGDVILENEIVDEINLSAWTPNVQPHEFMGRCPADDACDAQESLSTLKRQVFDNVYMANNPMIRVDDSDSRVNIEDFYNPEIGRPVRAPAGAAEVFAIPFVAQHTLPLIELEQANEENTTGFTRYAQGLDAQSLNQTARGIGIITNMSQQRIKMMARIFGEMCLKPCLRGIAKLLSQHATEAFTVQVTGGDFVEVDPREWADEYDLSVNVGLGVVDKDQQAQHLMAISQNQAAAVQAGGLGKVLTMKNLYNVQSKMAELAGIKDPAFAWTDPDTLQQQQPQGPTPQQMQMQAEQQKAEQQMQLEKYKADMQGEIERYKAQLKAETDLHIAEIKAAYQPQPQIMGMQ